MSSELLPPDPSKDGWYWVTSEDDGETFPLRWVAWRRAWEYGADIWSPGAALNCGYRLASPHPIPTPEQLDALHALPDAMRKESITNWSDAPPGNGLGDIRAAAMDQWVIPHAGKGTGHD